ncbi:transposase [Mesorhizobium sp. A623]
MSTSFCPGHGAPQSVKRKQRELRLAVMIGRIHDTDVYKHRNRIERCFNRLKHFRRFATRYDRRTTHLTGFVHLAAAMIWLR